VICGGIEKFPAAHDARIRPVKRESGSGGFTRKIIDEDVLGKNSSLQWGGTRQHKAALSADLSLKRRRKQDTAQSAAAWLGLDFSGSPSLDRRKRR
jgi:hypothetical protein